MNVRIVPSRGKGGVVTREGHGGGGGGTSGKLVMSCSPDLHVYYVYVHL